MYKRQRLDQLRAKQREHERAVATLQSRIDTLAEQAPKRSAEDVLSGFTALAGLVTVEPGLDRALAAALGEHAEALAGEVSDDAVGALESAARTVVVDARGGSSWRLDTDGEVDWLLDHITLDPSVTGPVTRLLADVVVADDLAAARSVVEQDPRLRAVTPAGVLVGEGWVAAGTGQTSTVEVSARIEAAKSELAGAQQLLEELAGTLEGATVAADEARVSAASAKAALREHDTEVESWRRDLARLVKQAEANKSEHERAAARANEADARLAQRRSELEETRDRLTRVDTDVAESPEEPSTEQRDQARNALNHAKSLEMEATLASRTAQQRAEAEAGKGDALRRQAEQERQAKARHEAAMARRRAEGELAGAVEKHARDLAARIEDALARATAQRDELNAQLNSLQGKVQQARQQVGATRQQLARLTDNAHQSDIARSQAQVRIDEAESNITASLGVAVSDLSLIHI